MGSLDRAYYDQVFDSGLNLKESLRHATRHEFVLSRIPDDAASILDAGCGDGGLFDRLPRRDLTVGVDFSVAALRQARGVVACARLDALCFPDASFDLVLATEVLEHLRSDELHRAVRELSRVARRYCIVSVPNRERLSVARVTCPECATAFHAWGHLRSFDPHRLEGLIPGFSVRTVDEVGVTRLEFPMWMIRLRRLRSGEPSLPDGRACPFCGFVRSGAVRLSSLGETPTRRALSFLARKRPSWLVATYERTRVGAP